jgi:hypothetical protein
MSLSYSSTYVNTSFDGSADSYWMFNWFQVDCSANNITAIMPTNVSQGNGYILARTDNNATYSLTVTPGTGFTINGGTSITVAPMVYLQMVVDQSGANWLSFQTPYTN